MFFQCGDSIKISGYKITNGHYQRFCYRSISEVIVIWLLNWGNKKNYTLSHVENNQSVLSVLKYFLSIFKYLTSKIKALSKILYLFGTVIVSLFLSREDTGNTVF